MFTLYKDIETGEFSVVPVGTIVFQNEVATGHEFESFEQASLFAKNLRITEMQETIRQLRRELAETKQETLLSSLREGTYAERMLNGLWKPVE